jgi:hypothetical protein
MRIAAAESNPAIGVASLCFDFDCDPDFDFDNVFICGFY